MTFEEERAIMASCPAIDQCIEAWESACDRANDAEAYRDMYLRHRDIADNALKEIRDLLCTVDDTAQNAMMAIGR